MVPLMAFFGLLPRHASNLKIDVGTKCSIPVRIVISVDKETTQKVIDTIRNGTNDMLLRFHPSASGFSSNGSLRFPDVWVGPPVAPNTHFEQVIDWKNAGTVDIGDANVFVIADPSEGEKSGSLRLSLTCSGGPSLQRRRVE